MFCSSGLDKNLDLHSPICGCYGNSEHFDNLCPQFNFGKFLTCSKDVYGDNTEIEVLHI